MEPYTEFIGTLQNSGFWLVKVVYLEPKKELHRRVQVICWVIISLPSWFAGALIRSLASSFDASWLLGWSLKYLNASARRVVTLSVSQPVSQSINELIS